MQLAPHPRLYITSEHYGRLQTAPSTPLLERAAQRVAATADEFLRDDSISVDETHHNYHLLRARRLQIRIVTLLVEWKRTGERRYRDAVLSDVRRMAGWEYWSWIAWRQNNPRPDAVFDLSCGENAATLAITFDALRDDLNDEEADLFLETACRRALEPYLHLNDGPQQQWWYRSPRCNWNTVCNGGAGMLALALGELYAPAARVLELVEAGIAPFFESLGEDGGWPEGIGYWNYGMRYGFMYLLSHEQATGQTHPLLERPGTAATLHFPLVFSPHGVACSFGDVNHFAPLPFHLLAALRLGREDVMAELERRLEAGAEAAMAASWPTDAELLLFYPRRHRQVQRQATRKPATGKKAAHWARHALQAELHWGYVADRMPDPSLYVAVRGGTLDAPHTHRDLLSYFCLVGQEKLIDNVPVDDYIDTTFSPRRYELYETSAASKNTIFINGVGVMDKSSVQTALVRGRGYEGFRMDATEAMGAMRDSPNARFCGRALLMIKRRAILVIDRVELSHAGLVESRLHTFSKTTFAKMAVQIRGRQKSLHVSFAASQPTLLKRSTGLPTHPPRKPDTIIRHVSREKIHHITLCHLLVPDGTGQVSLTEAAGRTAISGGGDLTFKLSFDTTAFDL